MEEIEIKIEVAQVEYNKIVLDIQFNGEFVTDELMEDFISSFPAIIPELRNNISISNQIKEL